MCEEGAAALTVREARPKPIIDRSVGVKGRRLGEPVPSSTEWRKDPRHKGIRELESQFTGRIRKVRRNGWSVTKVGTAWAAGLHRDEAAVLGLIFLGGREKDVPIGDLQGHVLAHGYAGPAGGRSGTDIGFACRWLARHGKVVRGYIITWPRRGYFRVIDADRE